MTNKLIGLVTASAVIGGSTTVFAQGGAKSANVAYAALRDDIKRHGVMAIVVDQHGRILDGHHRDRTWASGSARDTSTVVLRMRLCAVPASSKQHREGLRTVEGTRPALG
jgi:hypothetical protein